MTENEISLLGMIERQAEEHSRGAALNLMALGQDLIAAKALVPHGEWADWVKAHSGCGVRFAQKLMQASRRFGENEAVWKLDRSAVFALMNLPEGTEDGFLSAHDAQAMTAREIQQAVQQERAHWQEQVATLYDELEKRPTVIPDEVTAELRQKDEENERYKAELERLAESAQESLTDRLAAEKAAREAEQAAAELEEDLKENQREFEALQAELIQLKSGAARAGADTDGALTAEALSRAVRQFCAVSAEVGHMGRQFSMMADREFADWERSVETIGDWYRSARRALDHVQAEGGVSRGR